MTSALPCHPLELGRTRRAGLPDEVRWRCDLCGFSDTDRHGHFPSRIHRTCDMQRPPLTALGRLLDALSPGDGVARLARLGGLDRLARLWEQSSRRPCGCADRQTWLNHAWRRFVWRHFSSPVQSPESSD